MKEFYEGCVREREEKVSGLQVQLDQLSSQHTHTLQGLRRELEQLEHRMGQSGATATAAAAAAGERK